MENNDNLTSTVQLDSSIKGKKYIKIRRRDQEKDNIVTYERMIQDMDKARELISFFRAYPDVFADWLKGPDSKFQFFAYQRIFMRLFCRYKEVFITASRGASKSFIAILTKCIQCILYPGIQTSISAEGKAQTYTIVNQKIDEICNWFPGIDKEIDRRPGKTRISAQEVKIMFKNGSQFSVVGASQRSRGQRRHSMIIEEAATIDGEILNEVLLPMMSVSRYLPNGKTDPKEWLNGSSDYITSAGDKMAFAYSKLISILIQMVCQAYPNSFYLGCSYKTPLTEGQYTRDYIAGIKADGSYTEQAFITEFASQWRGEPEDSFFSGAKFDKCRTLKQAEDSRTQNTRVMGHGMYYLISVDVGRLNDLTEICVFRVNPKDKQYSEISLVNLYTYEQQHFEQQAINIKRLYDLYKPTVIVMDAGGLGVGLLDYMVKGQKDSDGNEYPPMGIINDEEDRYKEFITPLTIKNVIYMIKANGPLNNEIFTYAKAIIGTKNLKLLISEDIAKVNLEKTKAGREMSPSERNQYLLPYNLTTILKIQLLNLLELPGKTGDLKLKQRNLTIHDDKVKSFCYGLWYIRTGDEQRLKRSKRKLSDYIFYTPAAKR